ncbi:MAG TPA: CopG family transcriptional regulator [Acidimicrobiales bacterium]|nr:CopG family transcriptional regulator [Acidimicrobiales bacterium]
MALTVRTDEEMERALTELSNAEGTSRQEVIRHAVLDRYVRSQHRAHVVAATAEMMDRWGDVIERLSKT